MNALKDAITAALQPIAIDAGAVGFYQKVAPQKPDTPYVVFQKMSGRYDYTHDGHRVGYFVYMLKVIDKGRSSKRAEDILAALDDRLDQKTLLVGGVETHTILRSGDIDTTTELDGVLYPAIGALYRINLNLS